MPEPVLDLSAVPSFNLRSNIGRANRRAANLEVLLNIATEEGDLVRASELLGGIAGCERLAAVSSAELEKRKAAK